MFRMYVCVVAFFLAVGSSPSAAPPKPPPEIQAILDKKKHGQPLTMDDIKKLQDWAAGIQAHLPVNVPPSGGPSDSSAAAVHARIDVDVHYTRKTRDETQSFEIHASAPTELTAKANGTDDYTRGLLDPSAKISSFLFQSSEPAGTGRYHFHEDGSSKVDLQATLGQVGAGMMLVTVGGNTLGVIPGQINGEVTGTYHTVERDGKAHDSAYKGAMRESIVELLFPWEAHVTKDRTKPTTKPRAQISYASLVAALHSSKPTPLRIVEHFDWNDHGEEVVGDEEVTITIHASADSTEARIVADTNWDAWIPMGPTPGGARGNTFKVHIAVVDGRTGKPSLRARNVVSVEYKLEEVSQLPGVCTNWPHPGKAGFETKPDLFFAEAYANAVGTAPDADRQTYDLGKADWSKPIAIESRDFGGSGRVTAKVTLDDDTVLDAKFEPNGTAYLPLPRDDDHNHIADAWAPGKDLDPAADDEDMPAGFRTPGDGFTVMEEYRGFFVARDVTPIAAEDHAAEIHQRFDPKRRELIAAIETKDAKRASQIKRGIAMFESAADVKVYAVATAERMGAHARDYGRPRAVVFNVTPAGAAKAQASTDVLGVWISDQVEQPPTVARAWSFMGGDDCGDHPTQCLHSPSSIKYVALNSGDEATKTVKWMIAMVDPDPIDGAGSNTTRARSDVDAYLRAQNVTDGERRAAVTWARAHMGVLADEMATFAIMHELGHVIGAQHHGVLVKGHPELGTDSGDQNCPMRYWQVLNAKEDKSDPDHPIYLGLLSPPINAPLWIRYLKGEWNPAVTGPDKPWRIDRPADMGFDP